MISRQLAKGEHRASIKVRKIHNLHVRHIGVFKGVSHAYLQIGATYVKCSLGKGGLTFSKREGDLKTPKGHHKILACFFRNDRVRRLQSGMPMRSIRTNDLWCDDASSFLYNAFLTSPLEARHERLWRDDHQYDWCLPLDYNKSPKIRGRGSAIFLHIKNSSGYTAGCIAIGRSEMIKLIPRLSSNCIVII